jgi:hypothetical protein
MEAKHGYLAALFIGATALLVVFFALSAMSLRAILAGEVTQVAPSATTTTPSSTTPPKVQTIIEGASAKIVEVDDSGNPTRVIYESLLTDDVADFSAYAVPQSRYTGTIFVQAVVDSILPLLKVYPLNVETGVIGPSVINTAGDINVLSPNEEYVTITTVHDVTSSGRPTGQGRIEIFDLITGRSLVSQNLSSSEWLVSNPESPQSLEAGNWDADSRCYNVTIWIGTYERQTLLTDQELRRFCLE